MKTKFRFIHLDRSEALVEHTEDRLAKIEKYELKPSEASVVISAQRHKIKVEITLIGPSLTLRSEASSEDYYESVDTAIEKLCRQMVKRKGRVQHHKSYLRSHKGQIHKVTPELDTVFDETTLKARYRRSS